ncbi:MAG TPA: hypothetical protein EYP41_13825, partial [Anaerolineae bacterium]|nr:hypothetical protein [Anaerolineae bacterium]
GAEDALRDVKKQYKRNHSLWQTADDALPVYGTIASQFNDPGVNRLYRAVMETVAARTGADLQPHLAASDEVSEKIYVIPPRRVRYLSEIAEKIRQYNEWTADQAQTANRLYGIRQAIETLRAGDWEDKDRLIKQMEELYQQVSLELDRRNQAILEKWPEKRARYAADEFVYKVRGREIRVPTQTETLSHTRIPKVALPRYEGWGDVLRWTLQENVPGEFPYTAGVFPFKRTAEDPTRMFAGEGGPERTNRRFHYVSLGMPAKRLSTAFDSVTLYGEDPAYRPDIYGKVGNSGVSIASLDDAKKLYSGFNLCHPTTSVSMTINGPAATMLAFFMNTAVDQQCELYIKEHNLEHLVEAKLKETYEERGLPRPQYHGDLPEGNDGLGLLLLGLTGDMVLPRDVYEEIKAKTLTAVRGTVQADILKEDQAQNTCIFSTEFSLRLMGDVRGLSHPLQARGEDRVPRAGGGPPLRGPRVRDPGGVRFPLPVLRSRGHRPRQPA